MSRPYAAGTRVSVEKTTGEIRRLLLNAGATHYAFGEEPTRGMVQFALHGLHYRFEVRRPSWDDLISRYERVSRVDKSAAIEGEWQRRWRARLLWLKAQIEFAEVEPTEFARAMLAQLVLPDGRTMGEWSVPQIEAMYDDGKMPPLLGSAR
jgi:hypothetical protein